jgi:ParB family chromosome partitioning protein
MQLLDIDIISKGRYTWPFKNLAEGEKRLAQLSGISEAVKVRATAPGQYEIIGDPKAWYLAQAIQVHQIPTINVGHLKEDELAELARHASEKLGVIEQAEKVVGMLPKYKSKAALGRAHNMPRALVCNLVRIHAIADDIKDRISSHPKKVSLGHAKVIAGLDHRQQNQLLNEIINNGLSVHATEERARQMKSVSTKASGSKPIEAMKLEEEISELIGCETKIDVERGRVVIDYQKNIDILDGVLVHLGYFSG